MAISFFGAGPAFTPSGTANNIDLSPPASVPSGAVIFAAIALNSDLATLTAPSGQGWADVFTGTPPQITPLSGLSGRLLWKVSSGSEPDPYFFVLNPAQRVSGMVFVYTGVDTTTPFDVTFTTLPDTASNDTIELPAITPVTSGAWIARFGTINYGSSSPTGITWPAAHIPRGFTSYRRPVFWADKLWSGTGAEPQDSATVLGGTTGTSVAASLALKPAATSDSTPPSTVTGLTGSGSGSTVSLSWTAATDNVGVTGYDIWRGTSTGTETFLKTVTATTATTDVPGAAGTYYYVVYARDAAGNTSAAASNEVSATVSTPAVVTQRRTGAITPTGFTASAKFNAGTNARILASINSDMSGTQIPSSLVARDSNGYAKASVSSLAANTQYYYVWEMDGLIGQLPSGLTYHGAAKTAPTADTPASFTFAAASCATSGSNNSVFSSIAAESPLFFIHMGDKHYTDTDGLTVTTQDYLANYENQLNQSNQQAFEQVVPQAYVWSDHDWMGNQSSKLQRGSVSTPTTEYGQSILAAVYREIFPSYPVPGSGGTFASLSGQTFASQSGQTFASFAGSSGYAVWHSFQIGRFHFFLMDTRAEASFRGAVDNSSKTKLGTQQKQAFKDWLTAHPHDPKIISTDDIFHEPRDANYPNSTSDGWGSYDTERQELISFISTNNITNGVWIGGDTHQVAWATSANGTPAGWPTICAAPMDQTPSNTQQTGWAEVSPTASQTTTKIHQYAVFTVTDTGGSTASMTVAFHDGTGAAVPGTTTHTVNFTGVTGGTNAAISANAKGTGTALATPKLARHLSAKTGGAATDLAGLTVTTPSTGLTARTLGTGAALASPSLSRRVSASTKGTATFGASLSTTISGAFGQPIIKAAVAPAVGVKAAVVAAPRGAAKVQDTLRVGAKIN